MNLYDLAQIFLDSEYRRLQICLIKPAHGVQYLPGLKINFFLILIRTHQFFLIKKAISGIRHSFLQVTVRKNQALPDLVHHRETLAGFSVYLKVLQMETKFHSTSEHQPVEWKEGRIQHYCIFFN